MDAHIIVFIVCGAVFFLFASVFAVSFFLARKIIKPRSLKKRGGGKYNYINEANEQGEDWTAISQSGYVMSAKFRRNDGSDKYAVICPSYFGGAASVGYLSDLFYGLGYNTLCVDHRLTGRTKGKYVTFGLMEVYDAHVWCDRIIKAHNPAVIALVGEGMGASVAMMAASGREADFCVGYSPYIDFDAILTPALQERYGKILTKLIKSWMLILTNVDTAQIKLDKWCQDMSCPLLIIGQENGETGLCEQLNLLQGVKEYSYFSVAGQRHLSGLRENVQQAKALVEKFLTEKLEK